MVRFGRKARSRRPKGCQSHLSGDIVWNCAALITDHVYSSAVVLSSLPCWSFSVPVISRAGRIRVVTVP